MNVNIAAVNPPESLLDRIKEHTNVMRAAGFPVTEQFLLKQEPGYEGSGAMQVWLEVARPVNDEPTEKVSWVHIDEEGVAVETSCPVSGENE